jgi:hypothetical protein
MPSLELSASFYGKAALREAVTAKKAFHTHANP